MKYGGKIRSNTAHRESPQGPAAASGRGNINCGNRRKPAWVRLLGRAMLGQLVVVAMNYDFVRTIKSYDLARYAK